MVSWERSAEGIRLVSSDNPPIEIATREFTPSASGPVPWRPAHSFLSGRARALTLPDKHATLARRDGTKPRLWDGREQVLRPGWHVIRVGTTPGIACRFDGAVRVGPGDAGNLQLEFPKRTRVTLGASLPDPRSSSVIVTRNTLEGVLGAVNRLTALMDPCHPNRSWPLMRPRPPAIEFRDDTNIPTTPTFSHELTLELPADIGSLLVCAPLAYYLGSKVRIGDHDRVRLRDRSTSWSHPLPRGTSLETAVATVLQRVLTLDTHVRSAGTFRAPAHTIERLRDWDLDAEDLFTTPTPARLRAYLDVPAERVDAASPEWPLAGYLPPELKSARALPYLLDRLAIIGRPAGDGLSRNELIQRSLDAFYRTDTPEEIALLKPRLHSARYHVWFGDGVPIDVFTANASSIARACTEAGHPTTSGGLAVVVNDPEMSASVEFGAKASNPVSVHRDLSTAQLRDVFGEPHRLVHFIGHCDRAGLRCTDGHLNTRTIERVRAETFFLNACGSYEQGKALVQEGCRVGAVTFSPVVDRQAASVGKAFRELLAHGFCFERAIELARRQIMMGKDYAVIGDGTHRVTETWRGPPTVARAEKRKDGSVGIRIDTTPPCDPGRLISLPHGDGSAVLQRGREAAFALSRDDFRSFLRRRSDPIIFEGDLRWPESLYSEFDEE